MLHWIVLATSWNILSGYSGYFSFGHGAFFGAGIYTTAVLAGKLDWPFLWTLPAAALVAALLGVALGAVVFRVQRVRGELFALLTLAVTFVIGTIVLNTPIDGGPGVYLAAVPVPALGADAVVDLLPAGARRRGRDAADRLRDHALEARRRPVRDPRRRGRGRGDGRADLPLQAGGVRRSRARWPAWPAASTRCSSRT